MNDPIINAPISKIVEVIINKQDSILDYFYSSAIINEHKLTKALASLGGEGSYKAEEIMMKHIPSGCINLKGGYDAEKKAIVSAMREYASQFAHPSERELLIGFVTRYRELSNNFEDPTIDDIDRYLAEKQSKTGRTCSDCGTYYVSNGRCPECNPMG